MTSESKEIYVENKNEIPLAEPLPPVRANAVGLTSEPLQLIFARVGGTPGWIPGDQLAVRQSNGVVSHFGTIAFLRMHTGAFFDTSLRYFEANRSDNTPPPALTCKFRVMTDMLLEGLYGFGSILTCYLSLFSFRVVLVDAAKTLPGFQSDSGEPVELELKRAVIFQRQAHCVSKGDASKVPVFTIKGGYNSCVMQIPPETPTELLPVYSMYFYMFKKMMLIYLCLWSFLQFVCAVGTVGAFLYSEWIAGGVFAGLLVITTILAGLYSW